ncbi:hypothetical protein EIP86_009571 [Pleurotus ostreatoroseus]|nr:hypothetical protein EIP86_009571 [Pleurotus ostreatoroseus]
MVITDHFLWFFYFARVTQDARLKARLSYGSRKVSAAPGFADIATFFGICVWLAPLFLFLSLSANDNALPLNLNGKSIPDSPTAAASRPIIIGNRGSLFKTLYDALPLDYLPRLRPRPKKRDTSQGIIAPPSPNLRPMHSPLPSPGLGRAFKRRSTVRQPRRILVYRKLASIFIRSTRAWKKILWRKRLGEIWSRRAIGDAPGG